MVNPIPDSAAPPASCHRSDPGARSPKPLRTATNVLAKMPSSFPPARPAITPQVSVEVAASLSTSESKTMPAFASANNGTMTNDVHG